MIRVGLVGYGYAGRTFHAPLLRTTPGFELVLVGSTRADRVHADLPAVSVLAPEEVCVEPSVDLVVIATPTDTHVPLATLALRAGKHVVVEKPFAATLDEARRLTSLAQRAERVLAVFQNRRWDGDFLAVTELLLRDALGDISHFESHFDRYRPLVRDRWRERAGVGSGLWNDLGPHLVDQALQLFGLPERVTASLVAQRAGAVSDDWAHVILEYPRVRVILHASVLVPAPRLRFVVHGQLASWIKYGIDAQESRLLAALGSDQEKVAHDAEQGMLIDGKSGTESRTPIPPGDYGQFYIQLGEALRGAGHNPVPAQQALAVTAVVETATRSSAEGCALGLPLTEEEAQGFNR
jgi:predicted dehydrogenase